MRRKNARTAERGKLGSKTAEIHAGALNRRLKGHVLRCLHFSHELRQRNANFIERERLRPGISRKNDALVLLYDADDYRPVFDVKFD
jgi:hypothetical protein